MTSPSNTIEQDNTVTVVLPFFNEEKFINETLASLAAQHVQPARMILVDNASTDNSVSVCKAFQDQHPELDVDIIREEQPGKINAMEAGFKQVDTPFVAFCDADTHYPPHYLELALTLFANSNGKLAGAMGLGLTDTPESKKGKFQRRKGAFVGAWLAKQCHTGGYGQVFRTSMLRQCGGYSKDIWPYMQADHEVVHRMLKLGPCAYHRDLWCQTSTRRDDRKRVSWSLFEIIVYHITPWPLKDWYFYNFLQSRFIKRGMMNVNLRAQPWKPAEH